MELEKQIKETMRRAMKDLLIETCSKPELEDKDVDWIKRLCAELRDRINALTPRRIDLHAELTAAIDVDLIGQMLKHGAVDTGDMHQLVHVVYGRLSRLCAASQDVTIRETQEALLREENIPLCIATLLFTANDFISDIEELANAALKNLDADQGS